MFLLKQDEKPEDATLTTYLNAGEKGGDVLVIQLGSHSIKLGLASQMQPFLIPNICASPSKNGEQVVCDIEKSRKLEETLQEDFDLELGAIIRDVEKDLRYKKCHMIDDKAKS